MRLVKLHKAKPSAIFESQSLSQVKLLSLFHVWYVLIPGILCVLKIYLIQLLYTISPYFTQLLILLYI